MAIKLYEISDSQNARKVRLLAAELEIPLKRIELDVGRGELKARKYLKLNPNGMVPTIDDNGFILWESAAILRYLARKRPERNLLRSEEKEQAVLDQWMFWWTAHPEPALDLLAWEKRIKPSLGKPGHDPSIIAAAEGALSRFLRVLDDQLVGKDYILEKLSVVDFAAAPQLEIAPSYLGYDLFHYQHILVWLDRLQHKPYWKTA
jgi:glutathione S-transferase